MANQVTLRTLVLGVGLWLAASAAFAASCGCKPPPPPPPHKPPCCAPPQTTVNVNVQLGAGAGASAQTQTSGGGGSAASMIGPGPVTSVELDVGGIERSAYEAERTRIEKVVIQAFCFDDKEVPHPASQTAPDRDVDEMFDGELYRCIAGAHMQVTIAPWAEKISFEGGKTITCAKGEALYHIAGKGGGKLECRKQIPARDCNERSLLRRFGAGIKVLTLAVTETYTAYREESHSIGSSLMMLDGGVGGVVY